MTDRSAAAKRAWETRRRRAAAAMDRTQPEARAPEAALRAARGAVGRARRAGLPVDARWMLAAPDHIARQGHRCALTGIPFDADYRTPGAGGLHLAPSPDRIEPEKGCVPGSVRWVLWAVNRAKGEMPEAPFLRVCRAVVDAPDAPDATEGGAAGGKRVRPEN